MAKSIIPSCMSRTDFTSAANVASQVRCVEIGGSRTQASRVILRAVAIKDEREKFRWVKVQQASVYNTENYILELMANKRYRAKQIFGRYISKDLYQ